MVSLAMENGKFGKLMALYERYLAPVAFLAGFVMDAFTLTRADLPLDNLILILHLSNAALGIALLNAFEAGRLGRASPGAGRIRGAWLRRIGWLFPLMIQFSFGALFSGFLVLYARSGSWAGSWLFLGTLGILLVGNEFFRRRYRRLTFHASVYFVALFLYFVMALPILLHRMGAGVFVASGLAAVAGIALFAALLRFITPQAVAASRIALAASIGGIYLLFHILYFANLIPPIPLALRHLGIYHSLERTDGSYRVRYEKAPWYQFYRSEDALFRWLPGSPVFAASAVFAPTNIDTAIFHHWKYFDAEAGEWVEKSRVSYPMAGGRDGGYRGYSVKQAVMPGQWRVEVRTGRGELLGRTTFEIVETGTSPPLETRDL